MTKEEIFQLFSNLVRIESVSTDSKRNKEIFKAVDLIKKQLKDLDFRVDIYQKDGCPPLIIGKKIISSKAKTLGFYAHYDVQPEDPIQQWTSPPFKLTVKNGKIFGRGVADDKGHIIQMIAVSKNLIKDDKLKNNLIFIFEGEEEIGSFHFEELIKKDKSLKNIDAFYVIDMEMKKRNIPQIFYGLRGVVGFEIKITTSKLDLHSGVFGNEVLNPSQLASELMSKMVDGVTHKIKIPGFYNDVKTITQEEKNLLLKSNKTLAAKIEPSLDINGILSGYTGEGFKTIIPAYATVKFSIRLVPDQDYKKIEKLVEKFIKDNLPKTVKIEFKKITASNPFLTHFKNPYVQKTAEILSDVFKNETLFNRSGGSVGAAEILQRLFKKPIILFGFTLPDSNIHAPNENFDEEMFFKGISTIEKILLQ